MSDSIAVGWLGPTGDCWDWILGHFRDVSLLTDRNVESWLGSHSLNEEKQQRPAALFVAVESRFDANMDIVRRLEQTVAPKLPTTVPFCALLGNEWDGHRRTHPLSETLQAFYWYELVDRIIPWLLGLSQTTQETASNDLKHESNSPVKKPVDNPYNNPVTTRRLSPRVQRCIDTSLAIESRLNAATTIAPSSKLAMIVSETATTRQLWCDGLQSQKFQCLATTPNNLDVWAKPEFVVVDLESEPLAVREAVERDGKSEPREQLICKLARQFPDSAILVADSFPRWSTWSSLLECGADLIVAKPYQFTGIFDTLENVVWR